MNRRSFLSTMSDLMLTPLLGGSASLASNIANDNGPAEQEPQKTFYLPRSYDDIIAIKDDEIKIMLAAVTASGTDSAAYYTPAADGFERSKQVELYPGHTTAFAEHLDGYDAHSFDTPAAAQSHAMYHIPVYADDDPSKLKGIMVLHAPTSDFSRVQTRAEQQDADDIHEKPIIRQSKLEMAQYIVGQHADLFGASGKLLKARQATHHSPEEKKEYFEGLVKAMFKTFPLVEHYHPDKNMAVQRAATVDELHDALRVFSRNDGGSQGSHVLGVSEMMKIGIDKAVNAEQKLISDDQRDMVVLATLLHDVGKTQFSSTLMQAWPNASEEQKRQHQAYFLNTNHDHPLLSLVTLLLYPEEATTTAAHHHGLFRYTPEDMARRMSALNENPAFDQHSILLKDIEPEKLPALSRMMRVADVSEAVSGQVSKPIHETIAELEKKVVKNADGSYLINADTIDPDYLAFMVAHHVYDTYAQERIKEEQANGHDSWIASKTGENMYQPDKVAKVSKALLEKYHWDERKDMIEAKIREAVMHDPLVVANQRQAPQQAAAANRY